MTHHDQHLSPRRSPGRSDAGLSTAAIERAIEEHTELTLPRLNRFWAYYRNPVRPAGVEAGARSTRRFRLAQEAGLPARLTGAAADDRAPRPEVVIENDIAWRIQTMVDFMFGKPVTILSAAPEERTRRSVERVLDRVWENSGGIALLQDLALLGHVYGHVDMVLRVDDSLASMPPAADDDALLLAAEHLRVELIDPRRGIPIQNGRDYRELDAYLVHVPRGESALTEVITPESWRVIEDGRVRSERRGAVTEGLPVVHIQNIAQPFHYAGVGEVEPLIPLQDELNTRLSDRAARVTMQSFRMYLARGVDGFETAPVSPGQVWATDNPEASIQEFGGDGPAPGEEAHIREVREAMDKASGVPPLASGVVQARIGNLSSANALKVTLMSILSRTSRKRVTYGGGLSRMCRLILSALDTAGVFRTSHADRVVRLGWPDPLPEDVREQTAAAEARLRLGVPRERVLAELGYAPTDPGVT